MKERRKLVTEETIINVDEDVLKIRAEKLLTELFVDFVNSHFPSPVIEIKL